MTLKSISTLLLGLLFALATSRGESPKTETLSSPGGVASFVLSDDGGLHYEVMMNGKPVVAKSRLGLDLKGTSLFGPSARIAGITASEHSGDWENPFGQRRRVPDNYREWRVRTTQADPTAPAITLIVRAYDNGVAFRYEIPRQPGLEEYVVRDELTEFVFAGDFFCWSGNPSGCAECQYPKQRISELNTDSWRVSPLLVEFPGGFAAIAESDLLDWAGMFLKRAASKDGLPESRGVKVTLSQREDHKGAVVGSETRRSPWRVLLLARDGRELLTNDLIATLATPSRLADFSWVKPGIAAWDAWWTGLNPSQPESNGVYSRGDTRSHREYIDFAAEMGFRYQVMDWFWYEHMTLWDKGLHSTPNSPSGDFEKPLPHIDVPGLVSYARARGVGLWIWAHSLDIRTFGMERALAHFEKLGLVGIKVDFFNSESQETVQWVTALLEGAARHHLMVDLHGFYEPKGLARTYPNFITQEGVLGNEYNKLDGKQCDSLHTITLPFTRGLLGPMDFTPGGFLNRKASDFKVTSPTEVMGTRARQLAETVVYFSPLLVLCDSPENYRGQAGVEFFRGLPTVWDETVALSAEVGKSVVLARRSGNRWYLAAMNGEEAFSTQVSLAFLGKGTWKMNAFTDSPSSGTSPEVVLNLTRTVAESEKIELSLSPSGGFAAIFSLEDNESKH